MLKSVRFHSIYYRIVISIVVLFLLIVNQIAGRGIQSLLYLITLLALIKHS